jgi:ribose transport system substrate-binding protein
MVAATIMAAAARARADDYRWPDNIPPEAKALMVSPPLTPTGQVVPGYPDGAPAISPDFFKFSNEQIAKLKAGHFTAGIVIHTMDAGWPMLQIRGITETLEKFGIPVVATTNAKFQPGKQISDLEEMIARKPDMIFSIPLDPLGQSAAYKKAAASGVKLVFMDNVATDMTPGKDYVSVTASDNESNAVFAAKQLCEAIGAQRPYDQGVAEAKSAAYALLGEQVPPYIEVPTLQVTKLNLLSALKDVTKEDPPQSLIKL